MKKLYHLPRLVLGAALLISSAGASLAQAAGTDFVPSNPTLNNPTVIGDYVFTLIPTSMESMFAKDGQEVKCEVEVVTSDNSTYYIREKGQTSYLNGTYIPFTLTGGDTQALFSQFYAGTCGGDYVFGTIFTSRPEIQGDFPYSFSKDKGFTFNGNNGLAWLVSSSDEEFNGTFEGYSYGVYFIDCVPATAGPTDSYPASGSFDGWYKYTASNFTVSDAYKDIFTNEVQFQISSFSTTSPNILDFFMPNCATEYNKETGTLTLSSLIFTQDGTYIGIAPVEGGWKGMSGLYGNKLKWQIAADGTIIIPDFDLVTFSGNTVLETVAKYRSGSVVSIDAPVVVEPDVKKFTGTYPLQGTKYEYPNGVEADPETSALNFNLVINDKNQITSIGGYTLTQQDIEDGRNEGKVKGNNLIIEGSLFNGVQWGTTTIGSGDNAQNYTESWLLGGPNINNWDQFDDDNKVVFTLNDDGSYSLSAFTVWHRFWGEMAGEGGQSNASQQMELVFKWDDSPYADSEVVNPAIEGEWEFDLDYHYMGSESLGKVKEHYAATLDGTTVTFTSLDFDDVQPIIAEFVNPTTLQFGVEKLTNTIFAKYQYPFINSTGTDNLEDLKQQSFFATFDAENGTLTFPQNSGIGVFMVNTQPESYSYPDQWEDAFDFNGPARKTGMLKPVITLTIGEPVVTGNSAELALNIATDNMDAYAVTSWKASLTELINDYEGEKDTEYVTSIIDITVTNGKAVLNINDLPTGRHQYQVAVTAFGADNNAIAVSNTRAFSVDAGFFIELSQVEATPDYEEGVVNVTFNATTNNAPDTGVIYQAVFVSKYTADDIVVPATIDGRNSIAKISGLTEGTYTFIMAINAYDEAGKLIGETVQAVLPTVTFTLTSDLSGILGVDADNSAVRFFNLQGVEVANPEKGVIVIKVEGQKATKVIVR